MNTTVACSSSQAMRGDVWIGAGRKQTLSRKTADQKVDRHANLGRNGGIRDIVNRDDRGRSLVASGYANSATVVVADGLVGC